MIYEYALEPALLTEISVCRQIVNSLGIPKGRLASQFPEHWEDLVHVALADAMPVQKKRIEEMLIRLRNRMFPRMHLWDDQLDWITNADQEHKVKPFRAIVSTSNPGKRPYILSEADMDDNNQFWKADTTITIRREAGIMASAVQLLLESAKEVILVDPHFNPGNARHRRPLERFLQIIVNRKTDLQLRRLEYHTSTSATSAYLQQTIRQEICPRLPDGLTLKIIKWDSHYELHNRYILTNRGGISFLHGLDDGSGTDDVTLLSEASHKKRWRQYQKATCPFTFNDAFEVTKTSIKAIGPSEWG